MTSSGPGEFELEPIEGRTFGARIRFDPEQPLSEIVDSLHAQPTDVLGAFYSSGGLVMLPGMRDVTTNPRLLLRISQLFGEEVENYRLTLTPAHMIHPDVDEILILSNLPPCDRQPPPKPQPERKRRWIFTRAVSPSAGLAYRSKLSTPSAGRILVLCG